MAEEKGDYFLVGSDVFRNSFENSINFAALVTETAEGADHFFELGFEGGG